MQLHVFIYSMLSFVGTGCPVIFRLMRLTQYISMNIHVVFLFLI